MTRFAMGMNISRLSAPLYPALENILHQTMTAKTIGLWLFGPCYLLLLVMIFIKCDYVNQP